MITFYELDWRYSSTRRILEALSDGLRSVERDLEESKQTNEFFFDDDMALEHIDKLFGIAFVTVQAYITGTVSDANKIKKAYPKFKKDQLLKEYSDHLPNMTITRLELCDAIANYFKHKDEWELSRSESGRKWTETGHNQRTLSILRAVGIQDNDYYPCVTAANILLSNNSLSLEPLLFMLSAWREVVIQIAKSNRMQE